MKRSKIITFSGKARAGKDTSCDIVKGKLEADNFKVVKIGYGDYVKYLATKYFEWNGEKDEKGRTLLQWLGTDKIRAIEPNFWVDNVIDLAFTLFNDYDYIIICDCRFPNEIERWLENGFNVTSVLVERPGFTNTLTEEQKNHLSETALNNWEFDFVLTASNIAELTFAINVIYSALKI